MTSKAISAQNTTMLLENPNMPPIATGVLSTGSKSKPVYVTFDDVSKVKNGAPIYITGSGWPSIDNQEWVVQNIDTTAKTASLANSDGTNETAVWKNDAAWTVNAFSDVCATTYQINQTPATSIDTTTLCDNEKTFLVGFRDPGTLTFDFYLNPTDPNYLALHEAYDDGEERMFEIIYRNGAVRTLPVIVQSINETGGVDQAIRGAVTMKIVSTPILTQPQATISGPYSATATLAPASGDAPLHVTLTIEQVNAAASSFLVDWADDTLPETLHGVTAGQHDYATAGSFAADVTPTVMGKVMPPVTSNMVTVTLPYSATADVQPTTGAPPLDVTLTITETNGTATSFDIDWGDGSGVEEITSPTATHQYAIAGTFTTTATPLVAGTARQTVSAAPVTVA